MRTVKPARAFQKDFRREMAGKNRNALPRTLSFVLDLLALDVPLPASSKSTVSRENGRNIGNAI